MRVLLDTSFARRGPSGTAVYLERLLAALRLQGADVVEAGDERRAAPGGGGRASLRNLARDLRWIGVELPRRARSARAQVIHHPLPAWSPAAGAAQVVTVHDLAFEALPALFAPRYRRYAHHAHRFAARHADAVVCVSHATAREARAYWGVGPLVVAHHGPGQALAGAAVACRSERGHLLYVGDAEPRKNVALLLEGYRVLRARLGAAAPVLVLAGAAGALGGGGSVASASGGGAGAGIVAEPRPGRERLAELYASAIALVHPARHEGFGLTALEAMAAGTPVVAVRSPGLAEVCGEAAAYVGADDSAALADELCGLLGDDGRWGQLSRAGRVRAAGYSWERSARAHIQAYTLALEKMSRRQS